MHANVWCNLHLSMGEQCAIMHHVGLLQDSIQPLCNFWSWTCYRPNSQVLSLARWVVVINKHGKLNMVLCLVMQVPLLRYLLVTPYENLCTQYDAGIKESNDHMLAILWCLWPAMTMQECRCNGDIPKWRRCSTQRSDYWVQLGCKAWILSLIHI